jgi:hypothetical protein
MPLIVKAPGPAFNNVIFLDRLTVFVFPEKTTADVFNCPAPDIPIPCRVAVGGTAKPFKTISVAV